MAEQALTLTEWKKKAIRAKEALQKFREATESAVVHARHDAETVGAAVFAGGVRGAFAATGKDYSIPGPGGAKIPPEVPAGLLLLGIAFSEQTEISADLHAAGSGILGYIGGRQAEEWMRTREVRRNGNGGRVT